VSIIEEALKRLKQEVSINCAEPELSSEHQFCSDLKLLIKELEQREAITEAAKFLVKVKRQKDTGSAYYLASWPIALRKIEEALAQLPEEGE